MSTQLVTRRVDSPIGNPPLSSLSQIQAHYIGVLLSRKHPTGHALDMLGEGYDMVAHWPIRL